MQTDTVKLLIECNSGIKMGKSAIEKVMPHVEDSNMRHYLEVAKNTHAALGDETHELLLKNQADTKDPHKIAKLMSDVKICTKLAMKENDKTAADLITDGCDMGIKSISRYLNQYKAADQSAKSIARRIIASEEYLESKLRDYL